MHTVWDLEKMEVEHNQSLLYSTQLYFYQVSFPFYIWSLNAFVEKRVNTYKKNHTILDS